LQDIPYFRAIYGQMDNGGREAMLHDLLNRDISKQEFGKKLKRYLPGVTKKRLPSSNGYREKDGRSNHYVFPSLEVCRRDFERDVRMKIDWDE
jgi:hypothetical protein